MSFVLFIIFQILTNIAATYLRLDNLEKAKENIQQAYENRAEKRHERIANDVEKLQVRCYNRLHKWA